MGKLIEGLWDCRYCDTKGILGRYRECPNCGKARDGDTKFYMPQKHSYVEEDKAKKINRNPDWVCNYCGEQLNSDNDKFCKSCGAPRDSENLNYHQYQEKKKVESEEKRKRQEDKAKKINRNPDWVCNYCGEQLNSDNDKFCKSCGAPRDSENLNYHQYQEKKKVESEEKRKRQEEKQNIVNNKAVSSRLKINWKAIISILLGVFLVIGLVGIFIPREKEVTILELSWNREISIETIETFEENGWSLPNGAKLRYTATELHHYIQVLDHYETKTREVAKERIVGYEDYVAGHKDLGNGYFEEIINSRPIYETYYEQETYEEAIYRDEPVYQTKYYYDIDRWTYNRSVKTSGNDKNVYWGEVSLKFGEREGSRTEAYFANVVDKNGKESKFLFDFDTWNNLNVSQTVIVIVDSFGNARLKE